MADQQKKQDTPPERQSLLRNLSGAALGAVKFLAVEVASPALERTIPQGASELASALYAESGFVQYGGQSPSQTPEFEAATAHGPKDPPQPSAPEQAQPAPDPGSLKARMAALPVAKGREQKPEM